MLSLQLETACRTPPLRDVGGESQAHPATAELRSFGHDHPNLSRTPGRPARDAPVIRIAVVDDHAIVRIGLRHFLDEQPGMRVVAEAANGADTIELLRKEIFDVMLLDISMPQRSGIEVLANIRARAPDLPVLVLSGYPANLYADLVRRHGANAYLEKGCEPEHMIATIRQLHADRHTRAQRPAAPAPQAPHERLTPHEFEIFLRLARGDSNVTVARGMALSPATVSKYRSRVLLKLDLASNSDLTYYAVKNGLL